MKGDFSRFTFAPQKHYSRVFLQQGRVQLDADWNEQIDILTHQNQTEIKDIIGPSGVPHNDPGFGIALRYGLQFDGQSGYVQVQQSDVFSFPDCQPFTLEAWINPQPNNQGGVIVNKQHPTNPLGEYCLFLQPDGVVIFWQIDNAGAEDATALSNGHMSLHTLTTRVPIVFGQFNYIVVTSDGKSLSIYLNGHIAASTAATRSGDKTTAPLLIGAAYQGDYPTQLFQGIIEEIRLWNRAKKDAEIKAQMLQTSTRGAATGLVGHWRFDNGRSIAVDDRSSHQNQGLLMANSAENYPTWCSPSLWISRGRCYVDGILCENEFDRSFSQQPYLPGSKSPNLDDSIPLLIYLDIWPRLITAIQDPNVREIALGGPDTATRTQTIWQVKTFPAEMADWLENKAQWTGRLCMRKESAEQLDGNFLYRVEIHTSGFSYGHRQSYDFWPSLFAPLNIEQFFLETNQIQVVDWTWSRDTNYVGQYIEIFDQTSSDAGCLAQIIGQDISNKLLTLNYLPAAVESYVTPCLQQVATFKWSRENGSVAFPIERIKQKTVILKPWVQNSFTLKANEWVELADDVSVLQNRTYPLCKVVNVNTTAMATIEVELDRLPSEEIQDDSTYHPLLRRWDQTGTQVDSNGGVIPVQPNVWISLENGVQVYFEEQGFFQSGDYWWTPARMVSQSIEWPEINGYPTAQAPVGIKHHYVPLAWFEPDPFQPKIKDLRHFFGPVGSDFVRKTGDTMTGPLRIESTLTVEDNSIFESSIFVRDNSIFESSISVRDNSIFEGNLEVGTLYGSLAADIVSTEQVQDRAITPAKLSSQVGFVPSKFSILGYTKESPNGYSFTGTQLNVSSITSNWETLPAPLPQTGAVVSVSLNNKIYLLWESGEMWSYNLQAASDTSPWVQEVDLPHPLRYSYGVAVLDNAIYVVGGYEHPHKKSNRVEAYDPDSREWHIKAHLPTARSHLGIGVVNGKLFALGGFRSMIGGFDRHFESRKNEMYDPTQDQWIRLRSCPRPRARLGVTSLGGKLYAMGGVSSWFSGIFGNWVTKRTDVYSLFTNSWSKAASLPTPKKDVLAVSTEDQIYAFGPERRQRNTDRIDVYHLSSNRWVSEISLEAPRHDYGVVLDHGALYVSGGIGVNGVVDNISHYPVLTPYFLHVKN